MKLLLALSLAVLCAASHAADNAVAWPMWGPTKTQAVRMRTTDLGNGVHAQHVIIEGGMSPSSSTAVNNWPEVQSVSITNFPATQQVAGTVSIGNFPVTQGVSGTVMVSNFPATQAVTGTLSVSNFPATQSVTGTFWQTTQPVSGTFWQATQPVSVASLPLPTGAATAANQATEISSLSAMQASLAAIAAASPVFAYRNLTAAGTTTLKTGAGVLHTVNLNTLAGVASQVVIYDSTTGSGNKIATINALTVFGPQIYDVSFSNGLTIVITGLTPPDITVSYR